MLTEALPWSLGWEIDPPQKSHKLTGWAGRCPEETQDTVNRGNGSWVTKKKQDSLKLTTSSTIYRQVPINNTSTVTAHKWPSQSWVSCLSASRSVLAITLLCFSPLYCLTLKLPSF